MTPSQGRFMDDPNLKKLPPTKFDLLKILKIHDFLFLFYNVYKEKLFTIETEEAP